MRELTAETLIKELQRLPKNAIVLLPTTLGTWISPSRVGVTKVVRVSKKLSRGYPLYGKHYSGPTNERSEPEKERVTAITFGYGECGG